ncbi:hypothetical protein WJX73_005941 [Symbiochloris irregularis]|uniref:Uncharacterized protein n=1 Tax=Symbiochloris irregularis TaxID=706552 RepID=A0AAW1P930_9CHLO
MLRTAVVLLALSTPLVYAVQLTTTQDRLAPIESVPLSAVRLHPNSQLDKALSLNAEYMFSLPTDDLLLTYRLNAELPAPGKAFTGSWEDPTCEIRGQFMGHYLSALATLSAYTGNSSIGERGDYLISELQKVQKKLGTGYLSAFPFEHFDRLEALQPTWAPFYVIHKIMAGLLDQYTLRNSTLALSMVVEQADFWNDWVEGIITKKGLPHWVQMLDNEFGGMAEVLFNLYAVTGTASHLSLAQRFTKPSFASGLELGIDALGGIHANTHLAQVNGFAAGHEVTGSMKARQIVATFFHFLTSAHTYSTGGSNVHEFWSAAKLLGSAINLPQDGQETQETCTTYNVLKIARYLFRWTGAASLTDFYERALLNGIIGTQRMPADYHSRSYIEPAGEHAHAEQPGTGRAGSDVTAHEEAAAGLSLEQRPQRQLRFSTDNRVLPDATLQLRQEAHHAHVHSHSHLAVPEHQSQFAPNWRDEAFALFPGRVQNATLQAGGVEKDPHGPGRLIYLLPLGPGQSKDESSHKWGDPRASFWCCYGSGVEQMAKLADSIFFFRPTAGAIPGEVFITQFTSANLSMPSLNLHVAQTATLLGPGRTAVIHISVQPLDDAAAVDATINVRMPGWTQHDNATIEVNGYGSGCHTPTPQSAELSETLDISHGITSSTGLLSTFCSIRRSWTAGDVIEMRLPMRIWAEPVQDTRPEFAGLQAIMMGPFLMAGLTHGGRDINADPADVAASVRDLRPQQQQSDSLVSLQLQHPSNGQPAQQPRSHLALVHGGLQLVHNIPKWDNGLGLAASFVMRPCCSKAHGESDLIPLSTLQAGQVSFEAVTSPGKLLTRLSNGTLGLMDQSSYLEVLRQLSTPGEQLSKGERSLGIAFGV